MTREEEFAEWLKSENVQPFRVQGGIGRTTVVIKAPYSEDFTYLYAQSDNNGNGLRREADLSYAGIYYKRDGNLYDVKWHLKDILPQLAYRDMGANMRENVNRNICRKVENKLGNDKSNLTLQFLPKCYQNGLENFAQGALQRAVKDRFIKGVESTDICYVCEYQIRSWDDEDVLQCIADSDAYENAQADAYIAEHQEDILSAFMENDLIRTELQKLEQTEDSPIHRLRNIYGTMNKSDAKTVSVTLNKEGHTLTCKMHADYLSRIPYDQEYSTWGLLPQDRAMFENLFGYRSHIAPEDITDISYRGKSIYSAEPLEAQQSEAEGLIITQ